MRWTHLNERERRTVLRAGFFLLAYLLLFYGIQGWRFLEASRLEHASLRDAIRSADSETTLRGARLVAVARLEKELGFRLADLGGEAVIPKTLTAIQTAAKESGVSLDAEREVRGGASAGELAKFHFEAGGSVDSVASFLHRLRHLPFPVATGSLSLTRSPSGQGAVRLSVTVAVLDYDTWTPPATTEATNA